MGRKRDFILAYRSLVFIIGALFVFQHPAFAQSTTSGSYYIPEQIGVIVSDTERTLFGYVIEPACDQNGDGFADFVTWDIRSKGFLFFGGNAVSQVPNFEFTNVQSNFSVLDDMNSDGFYDFSFGGIIAVGSKLRVYYGGSILDDIPERKFGVDSLFSYGNAFLGSDFDNDGHNEIIDGGSGDYLLFYDLESNDTLPYRYFHPPNLRNGFDYSGFGERIVFADLTGDGRKDIVASFRPRMNELKRGSIYIYSGQTDFDTLPELIIPRPFEYVDGSEFFANQLHDIGDVNGDGFHDIFTCAEYSSDDTLAFVFFCGPLLDTVPDLVFSRRLNRGAPAGDVNHDGYDDFLASYGGPPGSGEVYVFLGGPSVDTVPDVAIFNSDIPGTQDNFGTTIAGIGDYNGDGVDDFAFNAINLSNRGEIYIYAGWKSATDIADVPVVPMTLELFQNYPNPFNPSTTIDYSVPRVTHATVRVYNALGAVVRTLVDERKSAGEYSVQWDGTNDTGTRVASGTYFYELSIGGVRSAKKMVLLK